jgi:predicted anti-sigma-YlaC factor YlaD
MRKRNHFVFFQLAVLFVLGFFLTGCSVKKMALNMVGNALTGDSGSNVFLSDNDPVLVGDALPFAIKMYESLMSSIPDHEGLRLQTGSLYIMYANAYIHSPAQQLTDDFYEKKEAMLKRAKNLYIRGRDIILKLLENKYPGFLKKLAQKKYVLALKDFQKKDVEAMYWASAGWIAAFSIDPFDMKFGVTLPQAEAIMKRALDLDGDFHKGAVHDFFVSYYGSMPDYMGGSPQKAREHFKKAVELSLGESASPYLSLASTVSISEQNIVEFKDLLNKVLKIDPQKYTSMVLQNVIYQQKARWMLDHIQDFFVEAGEE